MIKIEVYKFQVLQDFKNRTKYWTIPKSLKIIWVNAFNEPRMYSKQKTWTSPMDN